MPSLIVDDSIISTLICWLPAPHTGHFLLIAGELPPRFLEVFSAIGAHNLLIVVSHVISNSDRAAANISGIATQISARSSAKEEFRLLFPENHWVAEHLVKFANRHASGRIVSPLEGGYDLNALGQAPWHTYGR